MKNGRKMSPSRKKCVLCYSAAVLFYLAAVISFFTDKSSVGVVWLCFGSMFLCIGSANNLNAQKQEAAEIESAEKETDAQDSASPKDKE